MKTITSLASLVALASALFAMSASADHHFIDFYPINSGVKSMTGQMQVPSTDINSGIPYLWPGLLASGNNGVLQPVLDGRDGHWIWGNNYVDSDNSYTGANGSVPAPLSSTLSYVLQNSNDGKNNWYSEVSNENGDKASYNFEIGKSMTQTVFDCELYNVDWNFGDVVFTNTEVVAYGSDLSWCKDSPYSSSVNYKIEGLSSSTGDGTVTCKIDKVTLSPPS
ncbi:uncharacterized protein FA14DRAFT_189714 [Meira miltonrushii]|uniref:Uncharacterized protein n=1 Tax=Meira miltonrushii TaxID=1280837 RepID=A0A316VDZ7_9BASI|nr:uncharacterized protein FA14DRAFT_189714 [Meira miltonrushii]PWN35776.1 hypothetical protein FA14DRAFT_189714 [Meira miltonrushii]